MLLPVTLFAISALLKGDDLRTSRELAILTTARISVSCLAAPLSGNSGPPATYGCLGHQSSIAPAPTIKNEATCQLGAPKK